MFGLGTVELIIILVTILLVFGVGRISKVAGEMGRGMSEFRKGLNGSDEKNKDEGEEDKS